MSDYERTREERRRARHELYRALEAASLLHLTLEQLHRRERQGALPPEVDAAAKEALRLDAFAPFKIDLKQLRQEYEQLRSLTERVGPEPRELVIPHDPSAGEADVTGLLRIIIGQNEEIIRLLRHLR